MPRESPFPLRRMLPRSLAASVVGRSFDLHSNHPHRRRANSNMEAGNSIPLTMSRSLNFGPDSGCHELADDLSVFANASLVDIQKYPAWRQRRLPFPVISVMFTILRVPSLNRLTWTTTLIAEEICRRQTVSGMFKLAMATMVSKRLRASRGRIGVDGCERAIVARIHRLQHVERFIAANLTDDDSIRTHTQ